MASIFESYIAIVAVIFAFPLTILGVSWLFRWLNQAFGDDQEEGKEKKAN